MGWNGLRGDGLRAGVASEGGGNSEGRCPPFSDRSEEEAVWRTRRPVWRMWPGLGWGEVCPS